MGWAPVATAAAAREAAALAAHIRIICAARGGGRHKDRGADGGAVRAQIVTMTLGVPHTKVLFR